MTEVPGRIALEWFNGQPYSTRFGDVYFSREGGLEETRHVFIAGNRLEERFESLTAANFTIAELGFGTGLNFLCAWQVFEKHAPSSARLHFISFERYPLSTDELRSALTMFPTLAREAHALIAQYEQLPPGWHRLEFDDARVALTLVIGDARDQLPTLSAVVDAWFFDGFSPAKNAELWTTDLFKVVSQYSKTGTTFATYSVAGHVRRALADAGFSTERCKGFGTKREMLRGVCERPQPPLYVAPWASLPQIQERPKSAIVVGGGLAGTAVAHRLAARGIRVILLERHTALASEASGNAQAMLYIKPSPHGTRLTDLVISGYGYVRRTLGRVLPNNANLWSECGVLQLACDHAEEQRQALWQASSPPDGWGCQVNRVQASAIAGVSVQASALWFASGGWVRPAALCDAFARHELIEIRLGVNVTEIRPGEKRRWCVVDQSRGKLETDMVVLATANAVKQFGATQRMPLKPIRGQLTHLLANVSSARLKTILCGDGYIAPAMDGVHCLGATFGVNNASTTITRKDHEENLRTLAQVSAELFESLGGHRMDVSQLSGRAAVRCVSPDYLPLTGPLMDAEQFDLRYAGLAKDATQQFSDPAPPWLEHLYVSTGHGSRGLITAPIAAETIASMATNEPVPLAKAVIEATMPARFLARALSRPTLKKSSRRISVASGDDENIVT